jgi:hypothetical protein
LQHLQHQAAEQVVNCILHTRQSRHQRYQHTRTRKNHRSRVHTAHLRAHPTRTIFRSS